MKFKRRLQLDEEGIPITNLVDVLFLLIVFFMMSTVLSFDRGFGVKLPESQTSGTISNKGVSVLIARDGKVYVNGTETPLESVGEAVKRKQRTDGQNVILKSDKETRFQAIADVMDRLLAVGIGDLSLPMVERTSER